MVAEVLSVVEALVPHDPVLASAVADLALAVVSHPRDLTRLLVAVSLVQAVVLDRIELIRPVVGLLDQIGLIRLLIV